MIGHESVGSYALSSSKTELFAAGIGALLDDIQETMNRSLLPRLMVLNGMDPLESPLLKHGDVETPDLTALGDYVQKLSGAGMMLFPSSDGELERELLRAADLPSGAVADAAVDFYDARTEMRDAAAAALAAGPQGAPPGQDGDEGGEDDEATDQEA
jgi:hypothetical protein